MAALTAPIGLLAELTHRCPLACAYCSNPLDLVRQQAELDAPTWERIFREAAALGVLQVHLSGGEPASRRDLVEIVASARAADLYTNLITSGIGLTRERMVRLRAAGLEHVQLSIQDTEAASSDRIAGYAGSVRKHDVAKWTIELGLPLTLNAPLHRANADHAADFIAMALAMEAGRVELAHIQYYGWGLLNRAALMPTLAQIERTIDVVNEARSRLAGRLVIDFVLPDYYAEAPKPCMGGWGREVIVVTPEGSVLPCHAARTIPGLAFETVRARSLADIWTDGTAFEAFRGTDWMQAPCRGCANAERDWGGCRCQALALAGDAAATDPACALSPRHAAMRALAEAESAADPPEPQPRRFPQLVVD
ncbi:MAG: pyrroloquinoline quinone biosynthesis protein PqqE [Alphaproteobacteria bacterium]|nr:pyrroloquinoline quinone biosynthesis protein PqqE [Alphaproteobacteria bacterium]